MNVNRALATAIPAALPSETPDAGAVATQPRPGPASLDTRVAGNTVDAFEQCPRPTPPALSASTPVGPGALVSAAALQVQGAKALSGPIVVTELITTERTPRPAAKDLKPVHVEVPWYSQFEDHGDVKGGNTSCNPMVKEMMRNAKTPTTPGGKESSDNINIADTKDTRGRITPNQAKAAEGLAYINAQLESGHPVMVGVMWRTPHPGYNGGNADHYVVVTARGVDAEGREYYTFNDPGTRNSALGADTREENRFYVDKETGMLFRPMKDEPRWSTEGRYEVSQVRKNQEPPAPRQAKK